MPTLQDDRGDERGAEERDRPANPAARAQQAEPTVVADAALGGRKSGIGGQRDQLHQPTDGPRPSDCGVLESGDGWCRPSSSCAELGHQRRGCRPTGVCSSATSVLVVSSSPATEAPFCSADRRDPQRVDDAHIDHVADSGPRGRRSPRPAPMPVTWADHLGPE